MRSPNYPAYGLTETIEMARAIHTKERRTVLSADVLVKALGYNSMSGTARVKLASLRKFGMLESVNGGERISDLAMRLIDRSKTSSEYTGGLKEAALKPELYKELYGSHRNSSDDALRSYLITKKAFSENGAGQFIEAFRETLKLANLNDEAYTPGGNGSKPTETPQIGDTVQWESQGVLRLPSPRRIRALSDDGEWAFVEGSETGLPVKELAIVTTTASDPKETQKPQQPSIKPPTLPEPMGQRQDVFSLPEGPVTLIWPAGLSKESNEDLSSWLDIIKRKIGRSAADKDKTA